MSVTKGSTSPFCGIPQEWFGVAQFALTMEQRAKAIDAGECIRMSVTKGATAHFQGFPDE